MGLGRKNLCNIYELDIVTIESMKILIMEKVGVKYRGNLFMNLPSVLPNSNCHLVGLAFPNASQRFTITLILSSTFSEES